MKRIFNASLLALALLGGLLLAGPVLRQVSSPAEPPIVLELDSSAPSTAPAALAPASEAEQTQSNPTEILFYERHGYRDYTELVGLDLATGEEVLTVSNGHLTPDRERITSTEVSGETTRVTLLDLHGHELASQTLKGRYFIGRTSPDGRWLGMNPSLGANRLAGWQRGGQTSTRIAVVDTRAERAPRYVDLPGYFLVDGVSNDGGRLYLTENLPGYESSQYWVRLYDLQANRLVPEPVVEKGKLSNPQPMSGVGLDHVFSQDGQWQFTLYALGQEGHPFIHALPLNGNIAVCLDLPGNHGEPELEMAYTLAVSPDGHRLYAVNTGLQTVTATNIRDFTMRTGALKQPAASLPELLADWLAPAASAKVLLRGAAIVSPDGKTLYAGGSNGVWVIEAQELKTLDLLQPGTEVLSLALDSAGAQLFGADYNFIQRFDLAAGRASIQVKDPGNIIRLLGMIVRD